MFIDTYHSRIGFAPGTLTLCGEAVTAIEWDTASQQNNEDVWNKLVSLQNGGQTSLAHDNFCDMLQTVEDLTLKQIVIRTGLSVLEVVPYDRKTITLTLPGQEPFTFHATPRFEPSISQTVQVLHTALYFLSCQTLQSAEGKLAKLQMMRVATKNLP